MDDNSTSLLKQLVESHFQSEDKVIDPTTLRWALYARKSTESNERQARSIPDQIDDCFKDVIRPLGITVRHSDIFREEKSAKEAGTRPLFRDLIRGFKDGKYQGLIAWHPDRLARNMKDAGEIIDMLDHNVIKDLRFARAQYDKSASGKMTLGITFVLSKHYSEHLSESVNRGNRRITEKGGVMHKFVHGYRVTDDHRLIADDDNFLLVEQAFEMRKKGSTQKEIADYLNKSSYQRYWRGKGHTDYMFDEDAVSKMLHSPEYAGVVLYGKKVGLILDYDPAFTPMFTEQEFLDLHGEKDFMSKSFRATGKHIVTDNSNFLRRCIICNHCKQYMTTSAVPKKLKSGKQYYFYFRCENKGGCIMYGKNVRGQVIIDYVLDFLDKHRFMTEANYERYKDDVEEKLRFDTEENDRVIGQATVLLGKKKKEFENAKAAAADKDNELHVFYTAGELRKMKDEIDQLAKTLKAARAKKSRQDEAMLQYEEFLELFGDTVNLLRSTHSMATADEIIRIFFLNFSVKGEPKDKNSKQLQWSVIGHRLQKPYDEFVKNGEFLVGRGGGI
jgi:DNA invertase Pin-like site-specific DNA recombinase